MDPLEAMHRIDSQLAHVWMVRTFLKHSEEAEEHEDLQDIYRQLYDYMLALGGKYAAGDAEGYLRQAHKKLGRLKRAAEAFAAVQPLISEHTNFKMAVRSLDAAVQEICSILERANLRTDGSFPSQSAGSELYSISGDE